MNAVADRALESEVGGTPPGVASTMHKDHNKSGGCHLLCAHRTTGRSATPSPSLGDGEKSGGSPLCESILQIGSSARLNEDGGDRQRAQEYERGGGCSPRASFIDLPTPVKPSPLSSPAKSSSGLGTRESEQAFLPACTL